MLKSSNFVGKLGRLGSKKYYGLGVNHGVTSIVNHCYTRGICNIGSFTIDKSDYGINTMYIGTRLSCRHFAFSSSNNNNNNNDESGTNQTNNQINNTSKKKLIEKQRDNKPTRKWN